MLHARVDSLTTVWLENSLAPDQTVRRVLQKSRSRSLIQIEIGFFNVVEHNQFVSKKSKRTFYVYLVEKKQQLVTRNYF